MKKKMFFLPALLIVALLAGAINANANLLTYSDRSAWLGSVSGVTTIDFNSLIGQEFASLSVGPVTFDVPGSSRSDALWVSNPGSYTGLGIALVGNYSPTAIRATFSPSTVGVGVDVYNLTQNDNISVTVTTNTGNYNWLVPVTVGSPSFFGLTAAGGYISAITFTPSVSWVGIDNFSYAGSASVPLPPSMLLLAPGLVGLAGIRRRFKK